MGDICDPKKVKKFVWYEEGREFLSVNDEDGRLKERDLLRTRSRVHFTIKEVLGSEESEE